MKWCFLSIVILLCCGVVTAQEEAVQQREVTLQQAIEAALKNNLSLDIERYNPEITETNITFEKSKFEPLFSAILNNNDATFPTGSALSGESVNQKTLDYDVALQQKLFTGTLYSVDFRNSRVDTNQLFTSVNPRFNSSLFANVTQPLMRNFGVKINRAPLEIAMQDRISADQRLKVEMMDVALLVEHAYWDLSFQIEDLQVLQQSLELATELYENNKKQVEVGTMAPLEIVVAEAEVAARDEAIITLQTLIGNTEDRLKTLILGDQVDQAWDVRMIPVDKPELKDIQITEEEAIKVALENNPDIRALKSDLESRKLNTRLAANELKPQLDLRGSLGFTGLGGTTLLTDDNFPPNVIGTVPGGYGDALGGLNDNGTWAVGFIFSLPIGNRAAKAGYVRADLTEKQTARTLENARQQLTLNVRTALRNLQGDLKRLESARVSVKLQEQKLDAERKKLNVGLSTNFIVLDFQDDLAQAQARELQAIVDFCKDRAQLYRYLGETSYLK